MEAEFEIVAAMLIWFDTRDGRNGLPSVLFNLGQLTAEREVCLHHLDEMPCVYAYLQSVDCNLDCEAFDIGLSAVCRDSVAGGWVGSQHIADTANRQTLKLGQARQVATNSASGFQPVPPSVLSLGSAHEKHMAD